MRILPGGHLPVCIVKGGARCCPLFLHPMRMDLTAEGEPVSSEAHFLNVADVVEALQRLDDLTVRFVFLQLGTAD